GLGDLPGLAHENDLFFGRRAGLAADADKRRPDAVVIVLRPALEGMVVALGALNADPEEELGRRFGGVLRIAAGAPVIGGRIVIGATAGGEQLPGELIEGLVIADALVQPEPELLHAGWIELLRVGAQNVAGHQRPERRVVVGIDERVNQLIALVGVLV